MSPDKKPTKPVDVYVRVSRVNDRDVEESGGTAAEQVRRCRARLDSDNLKFGEVFTDLGESGESQSRPEFDKMLARIEDGTSGGVCVLNFSRFTRYDDLLRRILWVESYGAVFVSVEQNLDTSTPMGKLVVKILNAVDAMKVDESREQWASSQANALRAGIYIGKPPYGYTCTREPNKAGKLKNGPLRKSEPDASRIGAAYGVRARGGPWSEVARSLAGVGGKAVWGFTAARSLLDSELYKGVLGKLADGTPVVRSELAVTTPSTWAKVNPVKDPAHPLPGGRQPGAGTALLAGILQCQGCGYTMPHSKTKKGEKLYRFYQCKRGRDVCSAPACVKAEYVEQWVTAFALEAFAARPLEVGRDADPEIVARLEHALADAMVQRRNTLRLNPDDPEDAAAIARVDSEVEAAQSALDAERDSRREEMTPDDIRAAFEGGTVEERRTAIKRSLPGGHITVERGERFDRTCESCGHHHAMPVSCPECGAPNSGGPNLRDLLERYGGVEEAA